MAVKILSVFGTRPEAIKMAPVVRELQRRSADHDIQTIVCVTAQHREMLDQVLWLFGIRPDHDLNIMRDDQSLTEVTANALSQLDPVIVQEKPDWVLVQGDTTTAMVAALVAFYHRVKIGHVEAGLRTWDKFQPFPEEINRKIADSISDLHFAPTETARQNLMHEGIDDVSIRVTGNTVIDALHWVATLPATPEVGELLERLGIIAGIKGQGDEGTRRDSPALSVLFSPSLILVTAHRRENFGAPLENICAALLDVAARYGDRVRIVYPVHLNPNVQEPIRRLLGHAPNITLLAPLDYLPLVHLMKHCYLVLTDSGGIQEEAPGLGKPVLVLRAVTERPEAVEAGTVKVVGTDCERIVTETVRLLEDRDEYERMARAVNPYGDGHAAERIVEAILRMAA